MVVQVLTGHQVKSHTPAVPVTFKEVFTEVFLTAPLN